MTLSLGTAVTLLVIVLPRLIGVGWTEIVASLVAVPPSALALLIALWVAGLWAYTWVVTAALPGLTARHAFALNAVGGAASNVVPFGGALGAVATYGMARRWGHDRRAVLTATVVSNTCNVLARLALPAVGLGVLLLAGDHSDPTLTLTAAVGCGVCVVGVVAFVTAVWSEPVADVVGHVADATARRVLPRRMRPSDAAVRHGLHRLRAQIGGTIRQRWSRLAGGMAATLMLQAVLFVACLEVTGAHTALPGALAAFAVSRALTVVVLTPNGIGLSETGTAAVLVALGTPAAPAAAAVLLFGLITHVFEIVLGALVAVAWTALRQTLDPV